ncbi:TOBE domain-containing protein [Afifella pfennigii]|uniref:TOBE domain-containing protein n=1 Tax=Afifella pfennigii TaxID=209897 RepID=UPI00055637C4
MFRRLPRPVAVKTDSKTATLYVRPERIRRTFQPENGPTFNARVTDVVFKGTYANLFLEAGRGEKLRMVDIPESHRLTPRVGDSLNLTVDEDACLVF